MFLVVEINFRSNSRLHNAQSPIAKLIYKRNKHRTGNPTTNERITLTSKSASLSTLNMHKPSTSSDATSSQALDNPNCLESCSRSLRDVLTFPASSIDIPSQVEVPFYTLLTKSSSRSDFERPPPPKSGSQLKRRSVIKLTKKDVENLRVSWN